MLVIVIFSSLLVLFQYKPVQTWAAQKAAGYLSDQLHTKVDIRGIYIKPFSSVVLEGFYVIDRHNDTLISTPNLTVNLNGFSIFSSIKKQTIDFKYIELNKGSFYLKKQRDKKLNLDFIIDYFNSPDTVKTINKPWKITFEKVIINNFRFRYKNLGVDSAKREVNFDDLDFRNLSAEIKDMDLINHIFKGKIANLTLREKSGFYIKNLNAEATVDSNKIEAKNLSLITANSNIKNYFLMKFKSFDDIGDHLNDQVYFDSDFHSSRITSSDVSYFTEDLKHIWFDLGINGRISGTVNDIKGKNLLITGGKASYIKGNFSLVGLPNWNNTYLNLKFDQLATNKEDLDYLYNKFTGTTNRHVPDVISKFGNINYDGIFIGKQHDFISKGTFKTKLGRFDPDLSLKIIKNNLLTYNIKLSTNLFSLGSLIDEQTLGRVTLNTQITGSGDELKNLADKFSAQISAIEFNGYNYQNVTLNGTFNNKTANGIIKINDKNIKLNLLGNVDFNPELPLYDLDAAIEGANLNSLNFLQDTISLSTDVITEFSGNSLNNLTGTTNLRNTKIINPKHSCSIKNFKLMANGLGKSREIVLNSDIADGYIKGSYDLATLPSYFKTIIKKYAPSYKTTTVEPKEQIFDFKLELKNPDSLLAFIRPNLKIPEQGTFIGKFNSTNNTETLDVFIKKLQMGKTIIHDLTLDESAFKDYLGLNISANKVDLTDSLFIKDITVNNTIKNDSLNFNLKLSDQNAVNSLDLYGVMNFERDSTALIQLLPSDLILEKEDWRIADKVRIKFLHDKTELSGFELTNGKQKVKIDGFISDNPVDELKLSFEKFSMSTFNQLTKRQNGIALAGLLNGNVKFNHLLGFPGVNAHLKIDTMSLNKTKIGDIKIESIIDNNSRIASIDMNVINKGEETLKVGGTYEIKNGPDDILNFDLKYNQSNDILFQPFISDIVSNIKGDLSANLKITGIRSNPLINGNINLINTRATVNYLKTTYKLNTILGVNNSIVNLKDVELLDIKNGTGIINGTVNLNNITNPNIQLELNAKNLLALNTTFKDNHLYYGTAYGTGKFSFRGPLDNINIAINARTEEGTIFNIPLNTSTTVSDNDFIHFVSHNDTSKKSTGPSSFKGVTLNFDLSADEKTLVKITTEYGLLEGRGQANGLNLKINSLGDFQMFGDFLITSGKFDFTAQNFISKNFIVNQGGTIRWTGNPISATINIGAVYEVRTDIYPLYQIAGFTSPKGHTQTLVQAQLNLTNTLLKPDIAFDLNFPSDPSVKEDLSAFLSDNNNRSQQALNIILRRQFGVITNQVANTGVEVVSELLFNKVNDFISKTNIKWIDFNMRSLNDFSVSARIKDRLIITGNLFNTSTTNLGGSSTINSGNGDIVNGFNNNIFNTNFSSLTKDFELQYLITRDGALRTTSSYKVLENSTLSTLNSNVLSQFNQEYVTGLGLVYEKNFDSFKDLFHLIFKRDASKKKPKTPQLMPNPFILPEKPKEQGQ